MIFFSSIIQYLYLIPFHASIRSIIFLHIIY
jgi:hypothetical protein